MSEPATIERLVYRHLPGAGHSLHRDHTDNFLDAVVPFLEDATR